MVNTITLPLMLYGFMRQKQMKNVHQPGMNKEMPADSKVIVFMNQIQMYVPK